MKKLYGFVQNVAGEDRWSSEVAALAFLPYGSHTALLLTRSHCFLLVAAGIGSEDVYCDRALGDLVFQLLRSTLK